MAISRPKSAQISLCQFSCAELQPIEVLPSMALVHLLVHTGWWGQLAALGWARDRRRRNTIIHSQLILITAAIVLAVQTHVHLMRCRPHTLPT